jgi:hypothetical protein
MAKTPNHEQSANAICRVNREAALSTIDAAAPPCDSIGEACATLAEAVNRRTLRYNEIERRLFRLVYGRTNKYQEAGRILQCDWRTVPARVTATDPRSEGGFRGHLAFPTRGGSLVCPKPTFDSVVQCNSSPVYFKRIVRMNGVS